MCPAYAKKAGNECKKWAKLVPVRVEAVQSSTGVGFAVCTEHSTLPSPVHRQMQDKHK
jgi:hypothetical protein